VARKNPGVTIVRQAMQLMMASGMVPARVIKTLRPRELTYLCDLCDEMRVLRLCDDVFFDDDPEMEDEEEICPDE